MSHSFDIGVVKYFNERLMISPKVPTNKFSNYHVGYLTELMKILKIKNPSSVEELFQTYIYEGITVTMDQLLFIQDFQKSYYGDFPLPQLNCRYNLVDKGNNTFEVMNVQFPDYYTPYCYQTHVIFPL
jgi:hypothetical protein